MAPSRATPYDMMSAIRSISRPHPSFARPSTQFHGAPRHRSIIPYWRAASSSTDETHVEPPEYLSEGELRIFKKIKAELNPTKLEVSRPVTSASLAFCADAEVVWQVQDISGGCDGSFYGLDIVSPKFAGLPVVKQHKMVNQVLAEEMKGWHGAQLKTKAS